MSYCMLVCVRNRPKYSELPEIFFSAAALKSHSHLFMAHCVWMCNDIFCHWCKICHTDLSWHVSLDFSIWMKAIGGENFHWTVIQDCVLLTLCWPIWPHFIGLYGCSSSKHCFIEEVVQFSHCSHDIYSTSESVQLQGVTGVKRVVFDGTYDLKIWSLRDYARQPCFIGYWYDWSLHLMGVITTANRLGTTQELVSIQ